MNYSRECSGKLPGSPCTSPATLRCGSCGAVRYCSPLHQRLHWAQHKEDCERLAQQVKRGAILHDFPFAFAHESTFLVDMRVITLCTFLESLGLHKQGLWQAECECENDKTFLTENGIHNWHLPSSMSPCTDATSPLVGHLESWSDYYRWRQLPLDSPAAILLHWPLSLYHAIMLVAERTPTVLPQPGATLQIHYLGPERELDELEVFGELHALFPTLRIRVDFVGPAIPKPRNGEVVEIRDFLKCSDANCQCKMVKKHIESKTEDGDVELDQCLSEAHVTLKFWKGFYHDRFEQVVKDSYPHFIFAPNAGVAAFMSWLPTIKLLSNIQVPTLFTDYCEEAALLAAKCINVALSIPLTFPVQVNPFRQPLTPCNKTMELPTYSNCFIFGIC